MKNCYPADQLEPYTGSLTFTVDGWRDEPTVSLHEAARKQAPWNAFTDNACHCHSGCGTNKCGCRKKGISCSSHCYSGKSCTNKAFKWVWMVRNISSLFAFFFSSLWSPQTAGFETIWTNTKFSSYPLVNKPHVLLQLNFPVTTSKLPSHTRCP